MKRKLKKWAAADHRKILDENQAFFQTLIKIRYPDRKSARQQEDSGISRARNKLKSWIPLISTAAALVMAMVVTVIAFSPITDGNGYDDVKNYLQENIANMDIDLTEINATVNGFSIEAVDDQSEKIQLYYDSLSNDKLIYKIEGCDEYGLEEWMMEIEINDFYSIGYLKDKYENTRDFDSYLLNYYIESMEEDGLYFITTHAFISFASETLYIKYDCIVFEENDNMFFDWLQKVISIKN